MKKLLEIQSRRIKEAIYQINQELVKMKEEMEDLYLIKQAIDEKIEREERKAKMFIKKGKSEEE